MADAELLWGTLCLLRDDETFEHVFSVRGRISQDAASSAARKLEIPAGCRAEIHASGLALGGILQGDGRVLVISDEPLEQRQDDIRAAVVAAFL